VHNSPMNSEPSQSVTTVQTRYSASGSSGPVILAPSESVDYFAILRRRKLLLLATTLFCTGAGLGLTALQTPSYRSQIVLEVQGLNETFLNMKDIDPSGSGSYTADAYLDTQIKLLQTDLLTARVVDKLRLTQRPEYTRKPWWKEHGPFAGAGNNKAVVLSRDMLIDKTRENLHVSGVGQSRLVKLVVDSPDPALSAEIANTFASEYSAQTRESRWDSAVQTSAWLTDQLERFRQQLQNAENELQVYARRADLVYTGDKDSVSEDKLRQLQQELSRAQSDRVEKQAQLELISSSPPDSLPRVSDDGALRQYKGKLLELQGQLAELSASYTPEHYKIQRLQGQIAEVESALSRERGSLIRRIQNDYQAARRREEMLTVANSAQLHKVSDESVKAVRYNMLKRQVETDRELYQGMLQKVQGASIASALRASNVRIVDPAKPSGAPYRPAPVLNAAMGLGSGLMCSFLFVILRERSDRRVRRPGETMPSLRVPELGFIPSARVDSHLTKRIPRGVPGERSLFGAGLTGEVEGREGEMNGLEFVTWNHRRSVMAESFRAVATSLLSLEENGCRPRVVLVTSANAREGKTVMATNLAISLARSHRRVLLMDCDLRRPRLHILFGTATGAGLANILEDTRPVDLYSLPEIARSTFVPDLFILPSGQSQEDVFRLLTSRRLADLIRRCRSEFDCVILDSPPMLLLADARLLARVSDGVLMVCRAGKTSLDVVRSACLRMTEDGSPVLGTILNDFQPNTAEWQSYSQYATSTE
jgi:succinoglycan biosynthesis transport protein ExoP